MGFDLDAFHYRAVNHRVEKREELNLKEEEIAIAIIGRFAPIKDHAFFFKVAEKILLKTTKKIRFFVVGDGSERPLIEDLSNELNGKYENSVTLTSWVKDIASFNAAMDLICLTSKNEGTPVSLIEAQAANKPVVSTDVGGVRDVVVDGETGFVVPTNELNLFVDRLLELIEDEKKLHLMSQNGWNHVREKFHYETLVKNMDAFYKELLKEKGYELD